MAAGGCGQSGQQGRRQVKEGRGVIFTSCIIPLEPLKNGFVLNTPRM